MTMTLRRVDSTETEEPFLEAADVRVGEWGLQRAVRHHALRLDGEGRRRAKGSALMELCLLLCDGNEVRAAALREKWGESGEDDGREESANRIENDEGGIVETGGAEENVETEAQAKTEMEVQENSVEMEVQENSVEMEAQAKTEMEVQENSVEMGDQENNDEMGDQAIITQQVTQDSNTQQDTQETTQKPIQEANTEKETQETNPTPDTSSLVSQKTAASSISTDPSDPSSARLRSSRPVHGREGVFLRFHPLYRDYFDWMLQDGLDKAMVEEAMRTEGLDPAVGE